MSARNPCSIMVAGENKSFALSSLRGKSGTFMIPAYSAGGLPPTAWVISAVIMKRSEEHTSELQSQSNLVCRLLLEKKKRHKFSIHSIIHTNVTLISQCSYD